MTLDVFQEECVCTAVVRVKYTVCMGKATKLSQAVTQRRVLVLHFGGLRVDTCSRDPAFGVRNRLQPFATVCNRPCTTVVRVKLPSLWEKPQKRVFLDVSEDVLMSFCAAGVALCDI